MGVLGYALFSLQQRNVPASTRGQPVEYIFVGTAEDADCTIIRQGDFCMMIDTAMEQDADTILSILQQKDIRKIDLMVLSHPDADHIGGAAAIIEAVPVLRIVQPQVQQTSERQQNLEQLIRDEGIQVIYPTRTRRFTIGEIQVLIYPPLEKNYSKTNNYSLAVLTSHGNVNAVFAGDAEEKRLNEFLNIHWPAIDLYKLARHGRISPSSVAFLRTLAPRHVVCTAAQCDEDIDAYCREQGISLYYSVPNSTVIFESDKENLVLMEEMR